MKTLNSIKNYGLALLAMTLMLTTANAQSRYKHVPRVKVDVQKTEKVAIPQEKAVNTTTSEFINIEESAPVATENVTNVENTTVASTSEDVVIVNNKTKSVVKHHKVIKNNKKAQSDDAFTKNVKKNSKVMEVKDVKKTSMATWLLIMIICLAAALLFIVLAVIFLFVLYSGLYYLFYILAALCFIAAGAMLVLGLTGVMS